MNNKSKRKTYKRKGTRKKMKGGETPSKGLTIIQNKNIVIPGQYNLTLEWSDGRQTLEMVLTQYKISDENLQTYQNSINQKLSPKDCFINAMQLIGVFDNFTSNILRIACAGNLGYTQDQIEKTLIFSHAYLKDQSPFFNFKEFNTFEQWQQTVILLEPGHVILGGWQESSNAHVFLIGRHLNGEYVYLDPQVPSNCSLKENSCLNTLRAGETETRKYYALFNSTQFISSYTVVKDLGFDLPNQL